MGTNRKYWKGLDELHETPEFLEKSQNEFPAELSVNEFLAEEKLGESATGRRDFLKFLGFSVAAATLAACEAPVVKAVPYVVKPEDVNPGVANWYASTYYDGVSYASILVKTREGRPIHIKGNRDHGITGGTVNPQIAASVLSLYNSERLQEPRINKEEKSWEEVDKMVKDKLNALAGKKKKIVLLSGTEISPSTLDIIGKFKAKYGGGAPVQDIVDQPEGEMDGEMAANPVSSGNVEHIQYDAVSYSGIRKANNESFGMNVIPDYDFSKAKVIVSVAADFLNSWLLPTQFTGQYLANRNPDHDWMSRHFHFESNMSITGSNADVRGMIKPSDQGKVLALLHKEVTGTAVSGVDTSSLSEEVAAKVKTAAAELKSAKGESLVVAGSNRKSIQVIVNSINHALNNYNSVINLNDPITLFASEDDKMDQLVKDMNTGNVGVLITWNTNPAYSYGETFTAGLGKVDLSVAISQFADETSSNATIIAAENHALESWNDFNPKMHHYALAQPTIRPLGNTRSAAESLLIWADDSVSHVGPDSTNYYDYIRGIWKQYGFPLQTKHLDFHSYWNEMVHNSCGGMEAKPASSVPFNGNINAAGKDIASLGGGEWELALYQKAGLGTGIQAGNPWLQEMPDPITKVVWDNYITMSIADMNELGFNTDLGERAESNMATIKVGEKSLTLPVYPQAGQTRKTIGIALGYGRGANGEAIGKGAYQTGLYGAFLEGSNGGKVAIGQNAFTLVSKGDYDAYNISLEKSSETYNLACTQTHSTVMARNSIVRETTFDIYKSQPKSAYNHRHVLHSGWNHDENHIDEYNLWDEHPVEHVGHRWGMSIDLNSCIGCGSCLIACQSENNVPVVGKDEVNRSREMHWLRLDRYYASDVEATVGTRIEEEFDKGGFGALEIPSDNPKVVHMPMLCHHCNHAPCETVCPVAATTHSNEGLNQMAYNRCIGTRYCANNCPYKVRRFNWFDYPRYRKFEQMNPSQDDLGRMVLNPDVVVRTRGVMEKCSMCVQRIQEGKLVAKKEDRKVMDGDVTTACADVCPTNAITMGDWNDTESAIRKVSEQDRAYQVLEEVGVKPNIWYQVKVRNEKNAALSEIQLENAAHGHGDEHHGDEHHEEEHLDTGHGGEETSHNGGH